MTDKLTHLVDNFFAFDVTIDLLSRDFVQQALIAAALLALVAGLIGPFIDAWLKVHHDASQARGMLEGFKAHLLEEGIGTVSEIFDAEPPYHPRGCIAQAWSVAEVLRVCKKTREALRHS